MKYIRDTYNAPAYRGRIILFRDQPCRILSARGASLWVRCLADGQRLLIHPTWQVEYPEVAA